MIASEESRSPAAGQPPAAEPRRKRVRRAGRVTVFENWCKGCGLCVAFCPRQVLESGPDGLTVVAHPERCTACNWCYEHCPDFAIVVTPITVVEEEPAGVEPPAAPQGVEVSR